MSEKIKNIKHSLASEISSIIEYEMKNFKGQFKPEDKYYNLSILKIDQKGRVGKTLIKNIFEEAGYNVVYKDNATGDWDILINGFKVEIKLATLDVNHKFQHEGIKSNKLWDFVFFVDIAPNDLYFTAIYKNNFHFNENGIKSYVLFNNIHKNMHFRGKNDSGNRATGTGYKLDFNLRELNKVIFKSQIIDIFELEITKITD